jgi:hypothetical protein
VFAPNGVVEITGGTLKGEVTADELRIQGAGLFEQAHD